MLSNNVIIEFVFITIFYMHSTFETKKFYYYKKLYLCCDELFALKLKT